MENTKSKIKNYARTVVPVVSNTLVLWSNSTTCKVQSSAPQMVSQDQKG